VESGDTLKTVDCNPDVGWVRELQDCDIVANGSRPIPHELMNRREWLASS
jgi:hypothetical protein